MSNNYFIYDEWLSKILKKKCHTLNFIENINLKEIEMNFAYPVFLTARIPTNDFIHLKLLQELGFYIVDTNIQLIKKNTVTQNIEKKINSEDITITLAQDIDELAIIDIAKNSFRFSRFHNDPKIANEIANKIKSEWVAGFFRGDRGNQMIVAKNESKIIGFLQIINSKDSFTIDLIGVHKGYQKRGIATRMINFSLNENYKAEETFVGTQITNSASIKLYQRLNFNIYDSKYILHYHNTI